MAEQTMWAVKGPDGKIRLNGIDEYEDRAWIRFAEATYTTGRQNWRQELADYGYRCIRVKVTEVEGA